MVDTLLWKFDSYQKNESCKYQFRQPSLANAKYSAHYSSTVLWLQPPSLHNCHPDNCLPGQLPPRTIASQTTAT